MTPVSQGQFAYRCRRLVPIRRRAFSLLEIIIATAILAASAMVLTSLLGLGTKFGNRAEERTLAMSQAQSLLDEVLAMPQRDRNFEEEITGELPGNPPHAFRISMAPFASLIADQSTNTMLPSNSMTILDDEPPNRSPALEVTSEIGKLTRITVEIFEASRATQRATSRTTGSSAGPSTQTLCRISRVVRNHQLIASSTKQDAFSQATP